MDANVELSEKKPTLLVVDDVAENIDILKSILQDEYRVKATTNGDRAIQMAIEQYKYVPLTLPQMPFC